MVVVAVLVKKGVDDKVYFEFIIVIDSHTQIKGQRQRSVPISACLE